jgi:hypothetical protein
MRARSLLKAAKIRAIVGHLKIPWCFLFSTADTRLMLHCSAQYINGVVWNNLQLKIFAEHDRLLLNVLFLPFFELKAVLCTRLAVRSGRCLFMDELGEGLAEIVRA